MADAVTDPGVVTDAGLAGAYRDEALVTALLPDGHGGLAAVSSSTQPSLMVGMLDALDLGDHPRVLEIGTGTGYNAALMCHVLGDAAVHSVDVDPVLVDTARARLDSLGHHPLLAVGDGRAGLPSHAPYDRIIATCAFPEVPWAWAEQLVAGGLVLVDVKVALLAGNLALLRRTPDRLEGRFLPAWAGFMAVRERDRPPVWQEADPPVGPAVGETETVLDPHPLAASLPWFLAQIGPPPVVTLPPLRARLRGRPVRRRRRRVVRGQPTRAPRPPVGHLGRPAVPLGRRRARPRPLAGPPDGRAGTVDRPHGSDRGRRTGHADLADDRLDVLLAPKKASNSAMLPHSSMTIMSPFSSSRNMVVERALAAAIGTDRRHGVRMASVDLLELVHLRTGEL